MSEHIDGELLLVSEAVCQQVIDQAAAFEAVEVVFAAMARGDAQNFLVVRQAIGHAGLVLGVKSGGCWPHNV